MRLIDADAKILAQFYDEEHEEWEVRELTVADYLSYSDTAIPFVDAVPVVRCKDCKHRDAEDGFCEGRGWPMQLVPDDGFCDKGERSEE